MLIAHRGVHYGNPAQENRLEAFHEAVRLGVGVEFDVRSTADGVMVVHHDPNVEGKVLRNTTYSELQVRSAGHYPPTLDEVMTVVGGHVVVDVELKETECTASALEIVGRYAPPSMVMVSSFLWDVAEEAKLLHPE